MSPRRRSGRVERSRTGSGWRRKKDAGVGLQYGVRSAEYGVRIAKYEVPEYEVWSACVLPE